MRHMLSYRILTAVLRTAVTLMVFGLVAPGLAASAQELDQAALQEAKDRVLTALAGELPDGLPAGYLAVLPPEVPEPSKVDETVAATWATAWAELLQARRPEIELTERALLEKILREQKFGDSAYADPETAVRVGKLAAARMLLSTRLHAFHVDGGRIRVLLEANLLDAETGENLWSREVSEGLVPSWLRWLLGAVAFLVGAPALLLLARGWDRRRRHRLVKSELPCARERTRIDVEGLVRALADARERLFRAGHKEEAAAVQAALVDLDPVLDRVRHALPGGTVDRSRSRGLARAVREARHMEKLLEDLRRSADAARGPEDGTGLADRLRKDTAALRDAVDAYRSRLS